MARHVAHLRVRVEGDARRPRAAGAVRARSSTRPTSPTRPIVVRARAGPDRVRRAHDDRRCTGRSPVATVERPGRAGTRRCCARSMRLTPDRGVAALVDGEPVAIFRLVVRTSCSRSATSIPFSGASVLAAGIVGRRGDVARVASPMLQAALRPAHRPSASTTRRCGSTRGWSASTTAGCSSGSDLDADGSSRPGRAAVGHPHPGEMAAKPGGNTPLLTVPG